MIKSMTAFGRAKTEGELKDITIEIKSVNSRFFDCTVKIPRAYSFVEERIKAYVQKNAVSTSCFLAVTWMMALMRRPLMNSAKP